MAEKNLKIALTLSAVDRASMVMGKVFTRAEAGAKRLSAVSASMGMLGTKGIIAGGAMTAFFGHALKEAGAAAKATRQLNAAFDNLGDKGKEIAAQGKEFAEAYQFKIGVNDEEIQAAETRLAVFHKIFTTGAQQAQIFKRATKAAFDMRALGFGDDAASNAQKLGKLLNDPINNLNAMGRILGRINPLQKEHVKNLIAHRRAAEAQSYVLGLVENKFRDAAVKSRTFGDLMKVQLHDINIQIGNQLRPAYTALLTKITEILPKVSEFIKEHKGLLVAVAKSAGALFLFSGGIKVLSFLFSGFSAVINLVQGGLKAYGAIVAHSGTVSKIAAKGYGIMKHAMGTLKYEALFNVIPAIKQAGTAIGRFGLALIANPITWYVAAVLLLAGAVWVVIKYWKPIKGFFKWLWQGVKDLFHGAVHAVGSVLKFLNPVNLVIGPWLKLPQLFAGVWGKTKGEFFKFMKWVKGIGKWFLQAGKDFILGFARGMWSVITAPVRAVLWLINKVRGFMHLPPLSIETSTRNTTHESVNSSINTKPIVNAWANASRASQYNANRFVPVPLPLRPVEQTPIHFNPEIHMHGSANAADARRMTEQVRTDFDRLMKDHEQRKSRRSY